MFKFVARIVARVHEVFLGPLRIVAQAIQITHYAALDRRSRRQWQRAQNRAAQIVAASYRRYPHTVGAYATTLLHTDVAVGAAANAAIVNAPLGQLDQALNNLGFDVKARFGAAIDGVTDDTVQVGNAITAAKAIANGATLLFTIGTCLCAGTLDCSVTTSITFKGLGGKNSGAGATSRLYYTGAGARFINAQSSAGFMVRDLMIQSTSGSFAGSLIDFSLTTSGSARGGVFDCMVLASGTATAINLSTATRTEIARTFISGGSTGVLFNGTTSSGLDRVDFGCAAGYKAMLQAVNVSSGLSFEGITLEGGANVMNGAIVDFQVGGIQGGYFSGWWTGDMGATSGFSQLALGQSFGITIEGCFFGGAATQNAIAFAAASDGIEIKGNYFTTFANGIVLGAGCTNFDEGANHYTGVTVQISGVPGSGSLVRNSTTFKARAFLTGNQAIAAGTVLLKVNLNTETYDVNNNFDAAAAFVYTAPVAGFYLIAFRVQCDAATGRVYAAAVKNSIIAIIDGGNESGNAGSVTSVVGTDIVQLAAGDTVGLSMFTSLGGNVVAGTGNTFLAIHYLSS